MEFGSLGNSAKKKNEAGKLSDFLINRLEI